jgi:hypothetical protein
MDATKPAQPKRQKQTAPADGGSTSSTNLWDYLKDATRALIVIGALVGLTVFLAIHYSNVKSTTSVLGVVIPVLSAGIGAAAGAAAGNAAGKADKDEAVKRGRKALAQQMQPKVRAAHQTVRGDVLDPIQRSFASRAGERSLIFDPKDPAAEPVQLDSQAFGDADRNLAELQGIVDGVMTE